MSEGAAPPFVARYSVLKLLRWVGLTLVMVAASLVMAIEARGIGAAVGIAGVLFFGGIGAVHAVRLFDRREQVVIDSRGLYVRSHGETRIALRSIRTMRTDAGPGGMAKLCIYLHKPAKYPVETRHRRFIRRLNGVEGSRAFFGDVWIWQTYLDQPLDGTIRAIWAHRPKTDFERQLAAIEDAQARA